MHESFRSDDISLDREASSLELPPTPIVTYDVYDDCHVLASAGYTNTAEPDSTHETVVGEEAIYAHVELLLREFIENNDTGAGIDALSIGTHLPELFSEPPHKLIDTIVAQLRDLQLPHDDTADLICRAEYGPARLREGIQTEVRQRLAAYRRLDDALADPLVRGYLDVQHDTNGISEPQAIADLFR